MMHALRARFGKKKEIVAEFMPPPRMFRRTAARPPRKVKVMILLSGMPTVPSNRQVMEYFAKRGYWVFNPRYRGSWESGGKFLAKSPHEDVLEIIDQLPRGFKDIWNNIQYKIKPTTIHLVASSFGGPAAILASRDPRVSKAVLLSPVVDWRSESRSEPLALLKKLTEEAFGEAYRIDKKGWRRLTRGNFYNPAAVEDEIDGKKLFIIHAKDDKIVLPGPVAKFAKRTGAALLMLPRGGHLPSTMLIAPRISRKVGEFLA